MDASLLRAWWAHRQGLDGSLAGRSPSAVLERSGWARSVGGVGPYLTLFSRAGTSREAADAAVANLEIHELPAARGCTYVLPAADFALGLKVGQGFSATAQMKTAYNLGVTDKEIEELESAVVDALGRGPLSPDEIREVTGGASRSLGEAGKKKGLTTTLPLALGNLQAAGEIRRIPVNGRLDQQRYSYTLWKPNPLAAFKLSQEEAYIELAHRFFRWVGPATLSEFQWFSGLGVKAVKAAVEPLGLVTAQADGDRLLLPEDRDAFAAFKTPQNPQYVLVSSLDAITATRRDVASLLDSADAKYLIFSTKSMQSMGGLNDLPSHAILDRGRLIGLWEYDPESDTIAWMTFGAKNRRLNEAIESTAVYIRDQLGDARSFSLDSPKSRRPRIDAIKSAV